MDSHVNRRTFVKGAGLTGLGVLLNPTAVRGGEPASDSVVVAVAGVRSRGKALTRRFAALENCRVKYVVDVDNRYRKPAADAAADRQGSRPEQLEDFRDALADSDVDALAIATPDHWHAPMAIEALRAGKHVYVEKPCSHNPAEGEMLVKASKKYDRHVQMGNQRRSMVVTHRMMQEIRNGLIGDVYHAVTWYANRRGPIGNGKKVQPPGHLNWDLWQGPAPRTGYRDNVHPYNWHWFWRWGTGEAGNNAVHHVDIARWALDVGFPRRVVSLGGRYHYRDVDDWQCPDTQTITAEFDGGKTLTWEGRSCNPCDLEGSRVGVRVHGTEGTILYLEDHYKVFDKSNKLVKDVNREKAVEAGIDTIDPDMGDHHQRNFLQAIRGNGTLTSPIDEGYRSVHICLMGNIALRTNSCVECDPRNGHIRGDAQAKRHWSRDYADGWEPQV